VNYSKKWRFNFGLKKSKCLVMDYVSNLFAEVPKYHLDNNSIENTSSMDILGVTFSSCGSFSSHVENRIRKCNNSAYSLSDVGMCYPGLASETKSYLYTSICQPTLLYGLDSVHLTNAMMQKIDSCQGSIIKRVCDLPKRSHHSSLLKALNIKTINELPAKLTASLYQRIFKVNCPMRDLCIYQLSNYICTGLSVHGSITHRMVEYGLCPVTYAFNKYTPQNILHCDGTVDSLKQLIYNENFVKPWSNEYILTRMLTKAF
jgi:hypothetical protein